MGVITFGECAVEAAVEKIVTLKVDQILNEYEERCNKEINGWSEFTLEDVERELEYCTDIFMLMKAGDKIRCDCGDKTLTLGFDGKPTVYKEGTASPTEKDIPDPLKKHTKYCFGNCLLEDPSRHPGNNKTGGNPCVPYIVGTSWLETYNNAKAADMRTVLYDRSWLACRYMGRIMSADMVQEIDTTGMTEEEAFDWMLRWAKGEYIPQVLLDKITHIYAGGDEAVREFREKYPYHDAKQDPGYRGEYDGINYEQYTNIDKFDSKFIAWSKFVNNLWDDEQRGEHLTVRDVVLKAISMNESSMGTGTTYNGTINIMQSITIGDGTFWHMADEDPYFKTFFEMNSEKLKQGIYQPERNVLAWCVPTDEKVAEVTNGFVQFEEGDEFDTSTGDRIFGKGGREKYFGLANIDEEEDVGNPIFRESIKTVDTHTAYPEEHDPNEIGSYPAQTNQGEIIMVVYDQQSIDMSLYAAAILLANKGTTEKEAVWGYKGGKDSAISEKYLKKTEYRLKCLGTDFIN